MRLRGRARVGAVPVVALAMLLLAGCSQLTPGTAAIVNGTKITNKAVDDLANAQCVAADRAPRSAQATSMAISRVKQQSLGLLMDTELSLQYAKDQGITPQQSLSQGLFSQFEPSIAPLPGKARTVLTEVFQSWAKGRAILIEAGSKSTGQAPTQGNLDQLVTAGLQDRDGWLKDHTKITTDARYSPTKQGIPGGGDGSVSRAASQFAKDAGAAQPSQKWVSGLPPSQKCG